VLGRDERAGAWRAAGGLGPLIGDEGSAFWLGREWLRRTPGAATLARTLGRRARRGFHASPALAPRVLARARRGDRHARAVVTAGQAELAALALDVIRRLRLPVRARLVGRRPARERRGPRRDAAGVRAAALAAPRALSAGPPALQPLWRAGAAGGRRVTQKR